MKLTTCLLLGIALHVTAKTVSQTVTLTAEDVPLKKVFAVIEQQTGFVVFYNQDLLAATEPVSVSATAIPLHDFLALLLQGQGLDYYIENKTIFIRKKPVTANLLSADTRPVQASSPPITGIVRGPDGQPLAGVNVVIKGSKKGTTTDKDGKFSINANVGEVLVISSIGYGKKEIKVNGENNILVALELSTSPLDEVQIIAYGQTSKRFQTGNVATVKSEDIARQPVTNPLLALQGRVPGLFIEQATGLANSGVTIRIQGQNSLGRGNDPLIVIDGVPYPTQNLPSLGGILGSSGGSPNPSGAGNPLSFVNLADIESIEVLKDADATSIYGSRAAAGAILITTKNGKAGNTRVDVNMQNGWGRVNRFLDVLNLSQYLEMRREAIRNANLTISSTDYDLNGTWDTTRSTDWQKELIGGTAQFSQASISVSGGSETTQFLVGGTWNRQTTVSPDDLDDQRASVHFNLNNISANRKFRMQIDGKFLSDDNRLPSVDFTRTAITLSPNAPGLYNDDGTLNWAPDINGNSTWQNPLAILKNTLKVKTDNLIGNALLSYQLIPGLQLQSSMGYNILSNKETSLGPISSSPPEYRSFPSSAVFGEGDIRTWIIEPQVTYQVRINNGTLDMLAGSTVQQTKSNAQMFDARGFNNEQQLENIRAAASITARTAVASLYRYSAVFGRLRYNLKQTYIFNVNIRRDGSSRFGSANRFHNFGSVAGAWLFSNEGFVRKSMPFLSFGKLNASYGTTGNENIGDYQYMSLYDTRTYGTNYQGVGGLAVNGLPNPYLQWEETRKLSTSLSLGFLKERIFINASWYRNRSSNQLTNYNLPATTGFLGIARNFPALVQNTGWELVLNTRNLQTREFTWTSNVNFTIARNKLVDFPGLEASSYSNSLIIGKSIGIIRTYKFLEVDPQTGLYLFEDGAGHPTSTPARTPENRKVLVDAFPKFFGGFQNTFSFKGFELDVLFQFTKQDGIQFFGDQPGQFLINASNGARWGNQPIYVLDRWRKPGDVVPTGDMVPIQKVSSVYSSDILLPYFSFFGSEAAYGDASFIRLKNASLSWTVPNYWKNRMHLRQARLFIHGQNLLTITNYKGLDPETKTSFSLPPLRVITLGIQLTF